MSIDPPIIAAGPYYPADSKAVHLPIASAVPPESYLIQDVDGLPTQINQPADIEGRITVYRNGGDQFLRLCGRRYRRNADMETRNQCLWQS